MCFCLPISAQQQSDFEDNDNWKYFYDIGFESGLYVSTNVKSFQSASINTLHGSYFFSDKLGFRSGISYISGMDGCDYYLKVPLLFSFRTKTFRMNWWEVLSEDGSFGDFIRSVIFSLFPTRIEFNVGTSLGYLYPQSSHTYSFRNGEEILIESFDASQRFASSLDGNLRLSFQFWRICINGYMGFNYLWTNNFNHNVFYPSHKEERKPSWFGNIGAGASFRF